MLIAFSGLPGTGKSTISRALARGIGAAWLRIDSIEQAIRDADVVTGSLNDAGYRAAGSVAEDNLRLGLTVVADCVNPWMETRNYWRSLALDAGVGVLEVEIVCSDRAEHRRRVEKRRGEVPGLCLPSWSDVLARDYRPWERPCLVVDTARRDITGCVAAIRAELP
ncbi:AAA family ATPase [Consotaella salsifontis]|uniref:Predicted kinase n=1 Tax=Consotaella salsifontis TaxID=1365950 RepID=A0A1T4QQG3_9HYPH|nr:AAA family ATPase [Consotaella salsifontis]SKA05498.1 Predicted kinase [Consotaella salsifontis]